MMKSEELFTAAALTGLCANPHHFHTKPEELGRRASAIGKAVAGAFHEEEPEPEQETPKR